MPSIRAVNLDLWVQPGLVSPKSNFKGPAGIVLKLQKAWKPLYRTRKSTGTDQSKGGESKSPKSWTHSNSTIHILKLRMKVKQRVWCSREASFSKGNTSEGLQDQVTYKLSLATDLSETHPQNMFITYMWQITHVIGCEFLSCHQLLLTVR